MQGVGAGKSELSLVMLFLVNTVFFSHSLSMNILHALDWIQKLFQDPQALPPPQGLGGAFTDRSTRYYQHRTIQGGTLRTGITLPILFPIPFRGKMKGKETNKPEKKTVQSTKLPVKNVEYIKWNCNTSSEQKGKLMMREFARRVSTRKSNSQGK